MDFAATILRGRHLLKMTYKKRHFLKPLKESNFSVTMRIEAELG
jgi:hypothetical protein